MPTQTWNMALNGGLNSKIDPLQLTPNNLLICENARFLKSGIVNKRPGFLPFNKEVSVGAEIQTSAALATFNQELLQFDGSDIYTQNTSTGQWLGRGPAFSVINNLRNIVRTQTASQLNPDGTYLGDGYGNGIEVYTWEDTRGESRCSVLDSVTGSYILSDAFLFNGADAPKPISNSAEGSVTIYLKGLNVFLLSYTVRQNFPIVLQQEQEVFGDGYQDVVANTGFVYDAISTTDIGNVIAYNSHGGIRLRFGIYAPILSFNVQKCSAISCCRVGNIVYVAYSSETGDTSGPGVYLAGYDVVSLLLTLPPTLLNKSAISNIANTVNVSPHPTQIGNVICVIELPETNGNQLTIQNITADGRILSSVTKLNLGLASKAFINGSDSFINCAYQSPAGFQNTYYTICLTKPNFPVVCKMNDKLGGGYRTNGSLAQCDPTATGYLFASNRTAAFISNNNTTYSTKGLSASYLDFNHLNSFNSLTASNNLFITGGILQSYDGDSVVENNFHYYPEFAANYAPTQTAGGAVAAGQYQYQFTYEWTDQAGQVQLSTPSLPLKVVVAANNTVVTIVVPTLRLSSKTNSRSPVSIVMYRTQDNLPVYYKISSQTNNANIDSLTFTDSSPDSLIAANATLYTESQLANSVPPSCDLICEFGNRVVLAGLEDENTLWFSQDKYDLSNFNSVPMEFNAGFTIGVTSSTGPITAIARLDDKLIIFKKNAIYYINGTGPQPQGTGDSFPPPVLLVSDTGCNNQNSIQFCPMGLLFKSDKGIYLLDRGTNVSYIGAAVEEFNDLTITSAEVLTMTNEVVFTTLEGTVLVWNYFFNQPQGLWSTWKSLPSVDAVIWQNNLVLAQSDGLVIRQDPSTWVDNNLPYNMIIQTPWIGQLQNWQMVYSVTILMNLFGPHILKVVCEHDYVDGNITDQVLINSNTITNTWGSAATWGAGTWGNGGQLQNAYQYQYNLSRPMCQSIRLTFSDLQFGNYNQGFSLNNLLLSGQQMGGPARLPAARKF